MSEVVNPYIAGNPVTGTEMFFGRNDVFEFIQKALTGQHRDNAIVLYGQRRTGKTSVMYQMSRHLDARYLCIFIDMSGLAMEGLGGLLWEMANYIQRTLKRDHQIDLPRLSRSDFTADPRSEFENDFLGRVWSAIGDRHILLMLDEAIRLQEQIQAGKLEHEVFEYLRHLMQAYDRLNFMFSLGSGLEEMEKEYAFLFSVGLYKKISFLERDAATALITQPVIDYYQVAPAAIERILQVTSGHAYYTQLLCHSLFNRWQQQRQPQVQVADVNAILDEAVERGLAVLKHVWEESGPSEKAILAGMVAAMGDHNRPVTVKEVNDAWAKLGVALPAGETARAIRSLIARDVIAGRDTYAFTVDLQRLWTYRYERLEWVKEEIAGALQEWQRSAAADAAGLAAAQRARPAPRLAQRVPWLALLALVLVLAGGFGVYWFAIRTSTGQNLAAGSGDTSVIPSGDAAHISALAAVGDNVWAGTDGGLIRWSADGSARAFRITDLGDFPNNEANALAAAPDGTLWIGSGGVAHIRPVGDQVQVLGYYNKDDGLGTGAIRALLVDHDGSIWAGGPQDVRPPLAHFEGRPGPDGNAWRTDQAPTEEAIPGQKLNIQSLLRSRDGSLWVGLREGMILRWDGKTWKRFGTAEGLRVGDSIDDRIRTLLQDRNGTIWAAASHQGLLRLDAEQGRWQRVAVQGDASIPGIAEFADGSLWASGDHLVARSTDGGKTWAQVGTGEGLGANIGSVVQDGAGRVWAGAYDGGISVLDGQAWHSLQP